MGFSLHSHQPAQCSEHKPCPSTPPMGTALIKQLLQAKFQDEHRKTRAEAETGLRLRGISEGEISVTHLILHVQELATITNPVLQKRK